MGTAALIMAGGRGERMRASGHSVIKPLVPVLGVPMLERNLFALLRAGIDRIHVSMPDGASELVDYVSSRGSDLCRASGGLLEPLVESTPLGNIGCAGLLRGRCDPLLVVFADNVTTLDLPAVLARHTESGAAMTLAAHQESTRLPFGQLKISDGLVTDYVEKPVRRVLVSSGVTVLGAPALTALPSNRPTGLVELFAHLRAVGERVAVRVHDSAWIDVNDRASIDRAEEIVCDHADILETWAPSPGEADAAALVRSPGCILLQRSRGTWGLPSIRVQLAETSGADPGSSRSPLPAGIALEDAFTALCNTLPVGANQRDEPPVAFDDLEVESGRITRHVVRAFDCANPYPPAHVDQAWFDVAEVGAGSQVQRPVVRAVRRLLDST